MVYCLLGILTVSCELVAIATATISNLTASVMCHAGNVDVTSECCEAPCLFHALIILLPVYRSGKCLPNPNLNISHWGFTDLAKMFPDVGMVKYVSNVP